MEMRIIQDLENPLLGRRELLVEFPNAAGRLTRREAVEALASRLKVEPQSVVPIRLTGGAGHRHITARIYIYRDPSLAPRHLPEHILLRMLPKEERRKILEERRKARAAGRQPPR